MVKRSIKNAAVPITPAPGPERPRPEPKSPVKVTTPPPVFPVPSKKSNSYPTSSVFTKQLYSATCMLWHTCYAKINLCYEWNYCSRLCNTALCCMCMRQSHLFVWGKGLCACLCVRRIHSASLFYLVLVVYHGMVRWRLNAGKRCVDIMKMQRSDGTDI